MYVRLVAPGNMAELGTVLTLEGLTQSPWPYGPTSTYGGHEFPNSQPFSSQRRSAEEESQKPTSSLNALNSAAGPGQPVEGSGSLIGGEWHLNWHRTESEKQIFSQAQPQSSNGLPGSGSAQSWRLAQVPSASPGPTSRYIHGFFSLPAMPLLHLLSADNQLIPPGPA